MITVLSPGIYSTIQDLGRTGFAHIGVPISGAMDSHSASIGNQLLNNEKNAAVLEITFGNCKLRFEKAAQISITGADFNPVINGSHVTMNSIIDVEEGSVLTFGKKVFGVRTYIAISGGIQSEETLKSKSFYKGVSAFSLLKKGDIIPFNNSNFIPKEKFSKIKIDATHFSSNIINCSEGPEFELLSEKQQNAILKTVFTISNNNNRVGYQLEEFVENNLKSILTSGVLPGTVQLTPSGKLIVLMRDCQVTGGYPRVLQLSNDAISKLGQKIAGDEVRFWLKQ